MNKRYINQIVKRLQCSKSKRNEIKGRLTADFLSELESGENAQEIMRRMGTPREIAEEFNLSFSEEEKKKYKKEKWKKIICIILVIVLVIGSLIYWALPKTYDIEKSRFFQKDVLLEEAEEIIDILDEKDYEALESRADKTMKSLMENGSVKNLLQGYDWGERESFGDTYVVEMHQFWIKNAVVQIETQYEEASIVYTISFNRDMELAGLWLQ